MFPTQKKKKKTENHFHISVVVQSVVHNCCAGNIILAVIGKIE
jgi:hypothetical protein